MTPATGMHNTWTDLDLGPGHRCLIEASAGTGKTWTISVLYLRLLLEQGRSARQIVVATFTEAAAEELHERIRLRLLWAEQAAHDFLEHAKAPAGADDARYLMQRWEGDSDLCRRDLLRLRMALAEIDLAPIATLHGLCVRILRDYPFVVGSNFELGELVSAQSLRQELLNDLKRQLAQSPTDIGPGDARWLERFNDLAAALDTVADPDTRIEAPALLALDDIMNAQHVAALRAFADDVAKFTRSNSAYRSALRRLADYIEQDDLAIVFKPEPLLAERQIDKHIRPPFSHHPLLDVAAYTAATLDQYDSVLRAEAVQRHRAQLQRWRLQRLLERGLFTYDALIERVHAALMAPASALADALFSAWPVALIDEFQDTDARQYGILDRIYRDAGASLRGCLVMIGDAKQAIYAFRGGDIHAYRRAVLAADQVMSLNTNHRSARAYVAGLNAFYAAVAPGFGRSGTAPAIDYTPVLASARRDKQPYTIDGQIGLQPLAFHFRADPPDSAPQRVREALQCCASQIADLLQSGRHAIGARPLQPGDIAVLLPSNQQIAELRDLLLHIGVPCAGAGKQVIFESEWARELQVVLYAIAHCDDAPAVRAALSTRLLGWDITALRLLSREVRGWQQEVQALHGLLHLWQRQGVLAVVQRLIERAAPRLNADVAYERTITDLRHLGELLQEASEDLHGPTQLLAWLAAQRNAPKVGGEDSDERQLRIESDAARVRLLTLHASKGLEFPVVFLPLMWAHQASTRQRSPYPLVFDVDSGERIADLGTPRQEARWQLAAEDAQDERFRVLYVALTRAEYVCHVYALPPARPRDGRSREAPADPQRSALDALIERLLANAAGHADAPIEAAGIAWHQGWPPVGAHYRAALETTRPRRVLGEPLPRLQRAIHSFSTLVSRALGASGNASAAVEETAASDELATAIDNTLEAEGGNDVMPSALIEPPHPQLLALEALRGAELGNALHAVFEHRDQQRPVREQLDLLTQAFDSHAVRWRAAGGDALAMQWAERIDAALDADLGDGLKLRAVGADQQRAELEFHCAVEQLPLDALRRIAARHGDPELVPERLRHVGLNGLFTGKIDLVLQQGGRFHVLDYKGNALGSALVDYFPAAIATAMDAHHYRFQALIYVLAVDRMLAQRIAGYRRADQLGDAIYLFVRGAGLAPSAGVWRHRFADALINDMQRAWANSGAGS